MAMQDSNLAVPKGSLIVVTGANGFIASNVVDQLLLIGYQVRGTVRSIAKSSWMAEFFDKRYGEGRFSLAEVPDMSAPGAFDEAIRGASAIAHVATPVMQAYDPNTGIPIVVDGALNALRAAEKEPGVTRVVLTSSSTAAASPQPNKEFVIDSFTWNDTAIKAAWAPPPYEGLQRRLDVYSASKTQAEQAAWEFMKEKKPHFVLNAVLPNANMGKILCVEHQGYPSTAGWIKAAFEGFKGHEDLAFNPPQYYINVQDTARVHVAALIFSDVVGERLFAFAKPFSWNDMFSVFRKKYGEREEWKDRGDLGQDLSIVENGRAEDLVKRLGRRG